METSLPDREITAAPPPPPVGLREVPDWVPLLLAGDLDDGSEPHICRGID
jgi:hypothetical protein